MNKLDADAIRQSLGELVSSRLAGLEAFPEIGSTNSYLMQQAAPAPGQVHVVVTDNQTQGRGRHGRTWQSPPGSGLCLSLAGDVLLTWLGLAGGQLFLERMHSEQL